jgi:hypothetical protein
VSAELLPRADRWAHAPATTCVAATFESRRWPCSNAQHQPAHHWRQALVPPVGVTCLHPCSATGGQPRPASDPATPRCLPSNPRSSRALPAAVPDKPIRCARWDRGDASHIPDADRIGGSSLEVQAKQIEPSRHSPSPQRRTIGDRPQAPSAPGATVGGSRSRVWGGCICSKVELLPVAVGRPPGASVPACHRSPVAWALPRRRPSDGEDREELCSLEEEVEPISTGAGQHIEAKEESTQHRSCSSASTA